MHQISGNVFVQKNERKRVKQQRIHRRQQVNYWLMQMNAFHKLIFDLVLMEMKA